MDDEGVSTQAKRFPADLKIWRVAASVIISPCDYVAKEFGLCVVFTRASKFARHEQVEARPVESLVT